MASRIRSKPYRTLNNVIEGAVITFVDVAETKQKARALQLIETRFKALFDEAPLGMAVIDSLTGHIRTVNSKFAQILSRTIAEMEQLDWMRITHPDDVQKELDEMARLNAGEIRAFQMEKRYLQPDGAAVWISMTIASMAVEDP